MVERAVVLATGTHIDEADLPSADTVSPDSFFGSATEGFPTVEQLERRYIELVLQKTAGRKDKASQILGINRRTLYRKEREYGFVTNHTHDEPEHEESANLETDDRTDSKKE